MSEFKDHLQKLQHEHSRYQHEAKDREQTLTEELRTERIRSSKLHKQLTDNITLLEQLESKGQMYDQVKEALAKAEKELAQLTHEHLVSTHSAKTASEDREEMARRLNEASQVSNLFHFQ